MFMLLRLLWEKFRELDEKYKDERSENYFLLSYLQCIFISTAYYAFVKHIGPKIMEKRKAFDLKYVLLAYNAAQVLVNGGMLISVIYIIWLHKPYDRLSCMMPIRQRTEFGMLELKFAYGYYLLKLVDFADTVFFVLRKHQHQVSFLHVYHHILMACGLFFAVRYVSGGHGASLVIVNLAVHTIMYFYYFISALRPELKYSVWWKKHITQVQIAQFLLLLLHFIHALLDTECEFPKWALGFASFQMIVMLALFSDFYYKAYLRPNKRKLVSQANAEQVSEQKKEDFSAEQLVESEKNTN
ncbi:elongation of very long chain fatty acids protein F-like [Bactrocera neohumeralis]|uniref:elongation of very long chain fatty acids protein F-like n=1 Tax=Bactrocera tryoni TaxID=59916 RepID=UPI001A9A145A|nr:elongation of very long chain fatty acids protein F-like [Bactrocera tryoni]XP_050328257.1 elongation of very long chain fatty acids protein F-like [Bactrocera neohumeralis]